MPWNSTSPIGSISVKANRTTMNQNNSYIETTMGKTAVGTNSSSTRDHFWNVDPALDGHHRFVKGPEFTDAAGDPDDPVLSSGQGVLYFKRTSGRVETFYRNTHNLYQLSPYYLNGTHVVTSSFTTFATIQPNVYGEIFMFRATAFGFETYQTGVLKSTSTEADAAAVKYVDSTDGDTIANLRFRGGTGLDIQVRTTEGVSSGNTWNYYVTFRTYA